MDSPNLRQHGRAAIDFHCAVRDVASRLQREVEGELDVKGLADDRLPDDMDERHAVIDAALSDSQTYKARSLLGEWIAKDHGPVCQSAFDEIRAEIEPALRALDDGPATLEYAPDLQTPSYWSKVWFHRTTGGWDASDYNGFVHGELVHKLVVQKAFGDIFAMRRRAAQQAHRRDYRRILDMGASSGHYTEALAETFPDAEIWGVDVSARMLEHARRTANEKGWAWKLRVALAEETGLQSGSFGLVTSYILLHELPPRIIRAVFDEALRLLEPGGNLLMGDVQRYADLDKLSSWRFDWVAKWGGEPYWRASASLNLKALAEEAGFVDVEAYALPPSGYPYIVRGRKPAGSALQ